MPAAIGSVTSRCANLAVHLALKVEERIDCFLHAEIDTKKGENQGDGFDYCECIWTHWSSVSGELEETRSVDVPTGSPVDGGGISRFVEEPGNSRSASLLLVPSWTLLSGCEFLGRIARKGMRHISA